MSEGSAGDKMAWRVRGVDQSGRERTIDVDATDTKEAARLARDQGLFVTSADAVGPARGGSAGVPLSYAAAPRDRPADDDITETVMPSGIVVRDRKRPTDEEPAPPLELDQALRRDSGKLKTWGGLVGAVGALLIIAGIFGGLALMNQSVAGGAMIILGSVVSGALFMLASVLLKVFANIVEAIQVITRIAVRHDGTSDK